MKDTCASLWSPLRLKAFTFTEKNITHLCASVFCNIALWNYLFITYAWFSIIIRHAVNAEMSSFVNRTNLVYKFSYYIYCFTLHVSGIYVPIIRRNNCIYTTPGIFHSVWMTVWYAGRDETASSLHYRQSSIQSDKCQVSHKYNYFSWWWVHSCPKHVEKSNKHTKKICAPSWFCLQKIVQGCTVNKT
jgi:hypothetical protein